jgi:hypothetical protein
MIELRTQRDLRAVQNLDFCCICGKPFGPGDRPTRQHVPPKAIFADVDRTPPLILPAHEKCNNAQSPLDAVIGQLVATLHGKYPASQEVKLDVEAFRSPSGRVTAGVQNLPLTTIVFRWARYFHAALYREYLSDRGGSVYAPFPAGDVINGQLVYEKIHDGRFHLTHTFKQQVKAGRTDAVICYNGRCHYRCSWFRYDPPLQNRTFCLFALRLYNWEELGDPRHPQMGCIGTYDAEIPPAGARGTMHVPASNFAPLDPFAP